MYGGSLGGRPSPAAAGRYGHGQKGMGAAARRGGGSGTAAAAGGGGTATTSSSGGRRARSAGGGVGGSGATARSGSSGSRTGGGVGAPRGRSTSQGRGGVAPPSHALSPAPRPARPAVTNIATRQSTVGRAALLSPRAKVGAGGGGGGGSASALNSSHVSSAVGSAGAPTATVTMVVPHGSRAAAGSALPHPSALRHTLSADAGRTASPPLAAARRFSHAVDPSPAPAAAVAAAPTESTNEVSSTPGAAAGNDFASTNQAAVRVMQRVQRLMNVLEGKKTADPPAPSTQQQQQQPPSSGTPSEKPSTAGAEEGPSGPSSSPPPGGASKPAATSSASPGSSYRVSRSTAEIMRRYAPAAAAGVPKLPPGGPGGGAATVPASSAAPSTPPSLSTPQHQPLDPRYRPYYSTLQHAFSSSAAPTPPSQQQAAAAAAAAAASASAPLTPTATNASHARHRGMSPPPPPPPPSSTPPPLTYGRGGIGGAGGGTSALSGSYGSRVRGMSPPPRGTQVAGKMTTTVQSRHSVEREFSKQGLLASPGSLRSPTQQRPSPGARGGEARVVTIAPASDKESKDRARHEGVLSRLSERIVADAKTKMAAAAAAAPTTPPSSAAAAQPPPPPADGSDGGDKEADVTVSDLDLSTASLVGKSSGGGGAGGGGGGAAAAPETAAGEKQAEEEEEEEGEQERDAADAFSPEARVMAAPPPAAAAAAAASATGPVAWPVEPSPMREDLVGDAAAAGAGLQQRQQAAAYSSYGISSPPASTRESMQAPAVSPSVATDRSSSYHASNSPTPPPSLLPPPPPPPPHSDDGNDDGDDDAASVASATSHEQPHHHPRSPIIGGHPETQHPDRSPTLSPTLLPAAAPQFDAHGSSRAVSRSPRSEEGEAAPMLRVDSESKARPGPEKRIFSPPPQHPTRFHAQTHTQEVFGEDTLLPPPPPPVDGAADDVHRRIDLSGGIELLDGKSGDADAAAATSAAAAAASSDDDDDVLDSGLLVEGDAWGLPGTSGSGRGGMGRRESGVQCAKRRRAVEEVAWLREGVEAYVRSDRVRRSEELYESFERYGDGGAGAGPSASSQKTFRLKPEEVSDLVSAALTSVSCEDMRRLIGDTVAQAVELARARVARADRLPRCTFHRVPAKSLAAQMKQAVQKGKGKAGPNGHAAAAADGGGSVADASAATPLQTEVRRVCEEWVKEKLSDGIATDALAKKETTEAAAGWVLTSKAARGRVVDSWVDMMVTYLLHDTVDYFNSMEAQQG